ncbi:MAG: hypothetical protein WED05_11975 [Candidatus Atabeyarchaeum deiterrae]
MSKKVSFPVMSLTLTGVLFILGLLVLAMKTFLFVNLGLPASTSALINGLFGFLGAFFMLWALTSICLHPDIDDSNVKAIFVTFTVFIIILIFTSVGFLTLALY